MDVFTGTTPTHFDIPNDGKTYCVTVNTLQYPSITFSGKSEKIYPGKWGYRVTFKSIPDKVNHL